MAKKRKAVSVGLSSKPVRGVNCVHTWVSYGTRKGEFKCNNCPATCIKDRNGVIEEYDTHVHL